MKNDNFVIVIRKSPYHDLRAEEALRLGLGLTLRDIEVNVVFLGEGVEAFHKVSPQSPVPAPFRKHLETLAEIGQTLIVERGSLEAAGNLFETPVPLMWEKEAVLRLIAECGGAVIV